MTFRSDATEGVWSPTQNVAVQTEANVVAIFFFHQCGFYDPTHHIRGCQKIIWNFALKGRALMFNLWRKVRNSSTAAANTLSYSFLILPMNNPCVMMMSLLRTKGVLFSVFTSWCHVSGDIDNWGH